MMLYLFLPHNTVQGETARIRDSLIKATVLAKTFLRSIPDIDTFPTDEFYAERILIAKLR